MSTQTNQYLMWAIRLPYSWHKEWEKNNCGNKDTTFGGGFYEKFESFMESSAFKDEVNHKEGIYCLFDGRDGRFIFLGRVIHKTKDGELLGENEPLEIGNMTDLEKELIRDSVKRNFGIEGEFKNWIVTVYY